MFWKYPANLEKSTHAEVRFQQSCFATQSKFIGITLRHGCSCVNLLHIFRTSFPKNICGELLLQSFKIVLLISQFTPIYVSINLENKPTQVLITPLKTHALYLLEILLCSYLYYEEDNLVLKDYSQVWENFWHLEALLKMMKNTFISSWKVFSFLILNYRIFKDSFLSGVGSICSPPLFIFQEELI